MNDILSVLFQVVGTFFDQVVTFFSDSPEWGGLVTFAILSPVVPVGHDVPEGLLSIVRRWHGGKGDKVANVNQMAGVLDEYSAKWGIPGDMRTFILVDVVELNRVFTLCKGENSSLKLRKERDRLITHCVNYSLGYIRFWAIGQYADGFITVENIHSLCFLLPGETAGGRKLAPPTDAMPETKIRVFNEDGIMFIIDQAKDKNAGEVHHGWPPGVRHALILIYEEDGVTEVYREITTHLHNRIEMPAGSHGKVFLAKAAFLKHMNDAPHFGTEVTFAMPTTTQDLLEILHNQHQEDAEQHRKDVEAMEKEMKDRS
jgi:hypothetical protein